MRHDVRGDVMGRVRRLLLVGGLAVVGMTGAAEAVLIGAGTGIPNDESDSAGGRINVDQGSPVTLQPGVYMATAFQFDALVAGFVTPFLATGGGANNQYTVIAVSNEIPVATPGQDQSAPFTGANTFTITAPTQVFGGIASQLQNPIALDNGTGANTDHEGGGQAATSYLVTLGGNVPPDGTFSNPNLGRSYAFAINVELVPEPAALSLGVLGGLGLLARRRRWRR